jgi:hypothetical protein
MALGLLVGLLRRLVIELVDLVRPRRILLAGPLLGDRLDAVADPRAGIRFTVPSMTRSL